MDEYINNILSAWLECAGMKNKSEGKKASPQKLSVEIHG